MCVSLKMLDWVIVKAPFDHAWFPTFELILEPISMWPFTKIPHDGMGPEQSQYFFKGHRVDSL